MINQTIKFTIIKSVYDNEISSKNRCEETWKKFVKIISKPMITDTKESAPLVSPVEYMLDADALDFTDTGKVRRCSDNIKLWHMLGIDVDGQMTIEDAKERFKDYEYCLYTTHSHKTPKKQFDCFRVFILLKTPITNEDFSIRKNAIQEFIGSTDLSTLACSRGFYIYSHSQENAHNAVFIYNEGRCVDILKMKHTIEIPYIHDTTYEPPTYELMQKVLEQLSNLREIEYDTWWKICSAMQDAGYSLVEFEQLSNTIRSHRKNNCKAQWGCSKRKHIQFGYLVNICIDNFGRNCLVLEKPSKYDQIKERLTILQKGL
ncbi:MAG: PriCT-2 domain-containing protein [bacterium]